MPKLEVIKNSKCILGEAPLYNKSEDCFYWSDIKNNKIYKYDIASKNLNTFPVNKNISSFAFDKNNQMIVSTKDGFEYLELENGATKPIINPEQDLINNRFNDGKCDVNGVYFAGTMDNNEKEIKGSLYSFDGKAVSKKETNIFISNGLGWNKNSTKFYLTDSPKRVIYVYDYDLKTSQISNKKIFATIDEKDGYPDGLCIDEQDCIWSAHWNGWKITRYKPDGSIDRIIDMPIAKVTSCAFGGKDLTTLFITSASIDLSKEELGKAPLSGYTFILDTKIKGLKPNLFKDIES